MIKDIKDIGIAAYLLLNGFKLINKKDKLFVFEVEKLKEKEFEDMKLSYLASEFHHFDSCLMSLKKLEDYPFEINSNCFTYDLGCAAYLLLHRFRLAGKKGRCFYFETNSDEEENQFREMIYQYSSCEFHDFDAKLMSIKKI